LKRQNWWTFRRVRHFPYRFGRRDSLRALATAFESGVTYFDIARSYGYGQAESLLGEYLVGRRDQAIISTKFGIAPPPPRLWRDLARPVVRKGLSLARRLKLGAVERMIRGGVAAGTTISRGCFTPAEACASLDASLRALRTDHVEFLWLHDCRSDDFTDELRATLDGFVRAGKIQHYGPATDPVSSAAIVARHPELQFAQVGHSVTVDGLTPLKGLTAITHSPFGSADVLKRAIAACHADAKLRLAMFDVTGGGSVERAVPRFFLRFALAANPSGVVVCGMYNPNHIRDNAALAAEPVTHPEAIEALAAQLRACIAF
jgi:aryl-alcohol dehydrogenase-like predicted oxidoreductase